VRRIGIGGKVRAGHCAPQARQGGHGRRRVLPAFTGIACHDAWKPY